MHAQCRPNSYAETPTECTHLLVWQCACMLQLNGDHGASRGYIVAYHGDFQLSGQHIMDTSCTHLCGDRASRMSIFVPGAVQQTNHAWAEQVGARHLNHRYAECTILTDCQKHIRRHKCAATMLLHAARLAPSFGHGLMYTAAP
jgi:hypothetical protein